MGHHDQPADQVALLEDCVAQHAEACGHTWHCDHAINPLTKKGCTE
jgi:hypothetical protein